MCLVIENDKVSFLEGEMVDVRVLLGFGSMFGGLDYLECHMTILIFFLKGDKNVVPENWSHAEV